MIIAGADIETTGLDYEKGHKTIEICFSLYDFDTRKHRGYFEQRIHPQRSIAAEAQRVHGISIEDLKDAPTFSEVAPRIARLFEICDIVVAHNGISFDFPFLAYELAMENIAMPEFVPFDTKEARWATWNGKVPKLKELCFALGIEYDEAKAHSARYDVDVMMQAFFAGYDRGWFKLNQEAA